MSNDAETLAALIELRSQASRELAELESRPTDPHTSAVVTIDGSPTCFAVSEDGESLTHFHATIIDQATRTSRSYGEHVCRLVERRMQEQRVDPARLGPLKVVPIQEAWRSRIHLIDRAIAQYHRPENATVH